MLTKLLLASNLVTAIALINIMCKRIPHKNLSIGINVFIYAICYIFATLSIEIAIEYIIKIFKI